MLEDWDIVVVGYNSRKQIQTAWAPAPEAVRKRVILIDNGSSDGTVDQFAHTFSRVEKRENLGLSVGNNFGASLGTGKYVLFCNPDVTINEVDLDTLETHLRKHGGLVAPRLRGTDGAAQESARGWPTLLAQTQNRLGRADPSYLWPIPAANDGPVPWLLGAVIAVTRTDFERIGRWPEEYFLYFEDTELCMRAWDNHLPVWVLGSLVWQHEWARSSRSALSTANKLHMRSAIRFYSDRPNMLIGAPRHYNDALRQRTSSREARTGFEPSAAT